MAQTPLQPNYAKVFIQRDYSEGKMSSVSSYFSLISYFFRYQCEIFQQISNFWIGKSNWSGAVWSNNQLNQSLFCGSWEGKLLGKSFGFYHWRLIFQVVNFRLFARAFVRVFQVKRENCLVIQENWTFCYFKLTCSSYSRKHITRNAFGKFRTSSQCKTNKFTIPRD